MALVASAGTVTDAGTAAADGCELDSVTTKPPAGAGAFKVTVPVTTMVELPTTVFRSRANVFRTGALIVNVSVFVALYTALTVTTVLLATEE